MARSLADKFELDRASAEKFVGLMFDVVIDSLKFDKQTKVKGLGTFKMTSVAPRKSVDVNTGAPIMIEGRDKINFIADTSMRDRVNRPFAQFETVVVNEGVDFDEIDQKFAESMKEKEETDGQEEKMDVVGETEKTTGMSVHEDDTEAKGVHEDENVAEPEATEIAENGERTPSGGSSAPSTSRNEEDGPTDGIRSDEMAGEVPGATGSGNGEDDVPLETDGGNTEKTEMADTVLTLSASQLSVLNGRRVPGDGAPVEIGGDGTDTPGEPATEQAPALAETVPVEFVRPAEVSPDDDASDMAEKELEEIKNHTIELKEEIEHQQRNLKMMMTVGVVLLLVCVGGIAYMASQLHKRNNRIAHLEAAIVSVKYPEATDGETTPASGDAAVDRGREDSAKTAGEPAVSAKDGEAGKPTPQREAGQKRLATEKQAVAEAKREVEERKAAGTNRAGEAKTSAEEKAEAARQDKYNRDARIRTGAYRIVGIDHTVTVRPGQTLTGISNATLGPGMECYVEAVNDGRTEFKAGEKVNIPKLKLKKK